MLGSLNQNAFAHSTTGQFEDFCKVDALTVDTGHSISIDPVSPVAGDAVRITSTGGGSKVLTVVFKDGIRVLNHVSNIGVAVLNQPMDNVFDGTYEVFSCIGNNQGGTPTNHINGPIIFTVVGFPDSDNDGVPIPDDCDDLDKNNFPGNTETPGDQQDNNCNGIIDEFVIEDDSAVNELSDKVQDLMMVRTGSHEHDLEFGDEVDGEPGCSPIGAACGSFTNPRASCPPGTVMTGMEIQNSGAGIRILSTPICTPLTIADMVTIFVGGISQPVQSISLLLAYTIVNSYWMAPTAVGIGVGIYLVKRRF